MSGHEICDVLLTKAKRIASLDVVMTSPVGMILLNDRRLLMLVVCDGGVARVVNGLELASLSHGLVILHCGSRGNGIGQARNARR